MAKRDSGIPAGEKGTAPFTEKEKEREEASAQGKLKRPRRGERSSGEICVMPTEKEKKKRGGVRGLQSRHGEKDVSKKSW